MIKDSSKKTILITGASGNLGTEVIKTLHGKGYTLCATTGSSGLPADLSSLVADARNINLGEESQTKAYVEDLLRMYPDLDTAVLLVGGFDMGSIAETDSDVIDRMITLNFKTAYNVVRPLISHFEKKKHGQFILIGARPALDPKAGMKMMAYALSKSLVFQLSSLINAWGHGKNIHATVIVPSTIDTPANRKSMPDADTAKWVKAGDLAETIAFVVSPSGDNLRDSVLKMYNEA